MSDPTEPLWDDDGPTTAVPNQLLALLIEADHCPHVPDYVCGACTTTARDALLSLLEGPHWSEPRPAASPGEVDDLARSNAIFRAIWENSPETLKYDDAVRATKAALASLLGSGEGADAPAGEGQPSPDDDQRGERNTMRRRVQAERDAEKARADAAVEALAGSNELLREVMTLMGAVVPAGLRAQIAVALLPADTTEDGLG